MYLRDNNREACKLPTPKPTHPHTTPMKLINFEEIVQIYLEIINELNKLDLAALIPLIMQHLHNWEQNKWENSPKKILFKIKRQFH